MRNTRPGPGSSNRFPPTQPPQSAPSPIASNSGPSLLQGPPASNYASKPNKKAEATKELAAIDLSWVGKKVRLSTWRTIQEFCEKNGLDFPDWADEPTTTETQLRKHIQDQIDQWEILDAEYLGKHLGEKLLTTKTINNLLSDAVDRLSSIWDTLPRTIRGFLNDEETRDQIIRAKQLTGQVPALILVGDTSSGKSAFINLLLGVDIMPSTARPCNTIMTKLVYGTIPKIVIKTDSGDTTHPLTCYATDIQKYCFNREENAPKINSAEIHCPSEILKHMCIWDTPGISEHDQSQNLRVINELISLIPLCLGVIVINTAVGDVSPNLAVFVDKMRRFGAHIPSECVLFIINKWDQIGDDEKRIVKKNLSTIFRSIWQEHAPDKNPNATKPLPIHMTLSTISLLGQFGGPVTKEMRKFHKKFTKWIQACEDGRYRSVAAVITDLHSNIGRVLHACHEGVKGIDIPYFKKVLDDFKTQIKSLKAKYLLDTEKELKSRIKKSLVKLGSRDLDTERKIVKTQIQGIKAASASELKARITVVIWEWMWSHIWHDLAAHLDSDREHLETLLRKTRYEEFEAMKATLFGVFADKRRSALIWLLVPLSIPLLVLTVGLSLGAGALGLALGVVGLVAAVPAGIVAALVEIGRSSDEKQELADFRKDKLIYADKTFGPTMDAISRYILERPWFPGIVSEIWNSDRVEQGFIETILDETQILKFAQTLFSKLSSEASMMLSILEAQKTFDANDISKMTSAAQNINRMSSLLARVHRLLNRNAFTLSSKIQLDSTLIGGGAFSNVYQGTLNGSVVAVKQLQKGKTFDLEHEGAALLAAIEETTILKSLNHPNILDYRGVVLDFQPTETPTTAKFWILTELMDGSLSHAITEEWWKVDNTNDLRACRDIAAGLVFMHSKDILHRDMKLANVLYSSDKNGNGQKVLKHAKISDVGLSKPTQKYGCTWCGTPLYMAPEVEKRLYSKPSDVYSFGLMMLELFTAKSLLSLIVNNNNTEKVDHSKLTPSKQLRNQEVGQLVTSCIQQNPKKRPTATVVFQKLNSLK